MMITAFPSGTLWNQAEAELNAKPPSHHELRPETWTRLIIAATRPPAGSDPGTLPGSGP